MMTLPSNTSIQWLEIPDEVHHQSWRQSQPVANTGIRLQVYLNQVCLETVQQWLAEKFAEVIGIHSAQADAQVWEMVNGSSIDLVHSSENVHQAEDIAALRLVMIPTEAMDRSEFRVPQEWIDLPSWIGDYYLAVEVDTDEQWINIWGYTTHEQLKTQGSYDPIDRTYSISGDDLIQDLLVLWVMVQSGSEPTRSAVSALAPLSSSQAQALIQQLSDQAVILPRLAVPFAAWGALLEQKQWLQQLCQQRESRITEAPVSLVSSPENRSMARLSGWLNNVFEAGWRSVDEFLGTAPELAFSFRQEAPAEQPIRRVKPIHFGDAIPNVLLLVILEPEPENKLGIRVRVLPTTDQAYLLESLRLTLLSDDGTVIQSVQARSQDNSIQLKRFRCLAGMQFRVEVAVRATTQADDLTEVSVLETFIT